MSSNRRKTLVAFQGYRRARPKRPPTWFSTIVLTGKARARRGELADLVCAMESHAQVSARGYRKATPE